MFIHCSLLESVSGVEMDESSNDFEDYIRRRRELLVEEEEEEVSEPVDLSQFEPAVLPVSCGSVTGGLHKSRFAGRW